MGLLPNGLDLPAGIGLGLILALQLMIWFDNKGAVMPAVPTPIISALGEVLEAKTAHDTAASALSKAADDEAKARDQLTTKRTALEAIEDQHLLPVNKP